MNDPQKAGRGASGNVHVFGGGPAGLMAAEQLAAAGHRVILHDRMPSLGRKFLMAGRGGLNLTHSEPLDEFLERYGAARAHLEPFIRAFPPQALRDWALDLGQQTFVGTSGRVFPVAMKASPLLRAWLRRLEAQGVTVETRSSFRKLVPGGVEVEQGGATHVLPADAVLLALGGASWPRLGSDGGWAGALRAAGIAVTPLTPANAGVLVAWSDHMLARFAGAPLKSIRVTCGNTSLRGEAIVTRNGLEGGVIYALGPALRAALDKGPARLMIDLKPDLGLDDLTGRLTRPRGKASLSNHIRKAAGISPAAIGLLREAGPLPVEPAALAALIKALPLEVTGFAGLERAISTAGGIAWEALESHLMLRAHPGVFAAGEMLDWEAPTGGYLLQACFALGRAAGQGMAEWLAARACGSVDIA